MALTRVQGGLFGIAGQGNTATSLGTTLIENAYTVYSDYTLTTNNNALSVGPVTILAGKSITVPTGQKWVVL
jgi:hypothetical protein